LFKSYKNTVADTVFSIFSEMSNNDLMLDDPKITLQDVVKEGKKLNQNSLITKITVAGFCFGNSMMISFPDYFGMGAFEREYANFFGYMNLAFGIPVLFYSALDYFKSAWFSLRQKRLNLDVPLALGIFILFFPLIQGFLLIQAFPLIHCFFLIQAFLLIQGSSHIFYK
jgi:cation transport ATPase